ncbi:MAG: HD domain-containing protein [bacterium]
MEFQRLQAGMQALAQQLAGLADPGPDCWIVGGALRDAWLGRPVHDLDLVTPDPMDSVVHLLERHTGRQAFTVNQRFASSRIVSGELEIDITPMHSVDIRTDLLRRDYTVNAVAIPLRKVLSGTMTADDILSVPGSFEDLAAGRLRMISEHNLQEDPLRLLRGFRLAAQLELQPDAETVAAWQRNATLLPNSSGERQREELLRWFGQPGLDTGLLQLAADCGVLWQLFPALRDSVGCVQNHYHHLDVWQHTLLALDKLDELLRQLPAELEAYREDFVKAMEAVPEGGASVLSLTRLALLLHDVGKPATRREEEDGYISFIGHQKTGVELVSGDFTRLRCSGAQHDFLKCMIHEHLRLGFYCATEPLPAKLIYRFIRSLGEATLPQLLHSLADCSAALGSDSEESLRRHISAARQIADNFINDSAVARPPVLLDGNAIMRLLELRPGPFVGRCKKAMLEATAEGLISTEEEAREFILELARTGRGGSD